MMNKFFLLGLLFPILSFSQELTNEVIWNTGAFYARTVQGFNGMNDGQSYSYIEDNIIYRGFITKPKKKEVIFDPEGTFQIGDYTFSEDESMLLIAYNQKPLYRYSYSAAYYAFDFFMNDLKLIGEGAEDIYYATFSPDNKKVAYVRQNNLYIQELSTGKITQITNDGSYGGIINGQSDWVYEEEFTLTRSFEWSADSKYIAFLKFDESEVKEFDMAIYGSLYPEHYKFKYPKAGEANSKVSLHVANAKTGDVDNIFLGKYEYIPRLKRTNDGNKFMVLSMNRHQSELNYHLIQLQAEKWLSKVVFTEKSKTYVEIDDNLIFLSSGTGFIRTSEKDGFNHIYKINFDGTETQLTSGEWDVISLDYYDPLGTIYYSSAEEGTLYKSFYKISTKGKKKTKLSSKLGYNESEVIKGGAFYVNTYSNANEPYTVTLYKTDGTLVRELANNNVVMENMKYMNFTPRTFFKVKGGTDSLNASVIYPPDFDESKEYPVYMFVYGGPGSNKVLDTWGRHDYVYHQLLAQKGYIVVSVDPRGTMYRGAEFKKSTYLQLGKLETEDVIAAAKELGKLNYIDANRIGIQGWSFGGYLSSLAISKGADVFKMAIAVAPVTNWRYYDNIYTERFMRTPQENAEGYDENSPINFVEMIKGNYLIIHGSADDNVHMQNTLEMVSAMIDKDVRFEMYIYPNKNHGIYGGNTRKHLFDRMLEFTLRSL